MNRSPIAFLWILTYGLVCAAQDWVVGPQDTIMSVVRRAEANDRILVPAGTYREKIVIDKTVHLVGQDRPVLDGKDQGTIITIEADGVSVSGFKIQNIDVSFMEDRAGIKLKSVKNCEIFENELENTFFAIYLERCENCVVRDNYLHGKETREATSGNGIHLWHCRNINIDKNHIVGHRDGIYFEFVEDGTITNNLSEKNLRYGLHFMFSHQNAYLYNVFSQNGAGVAVMYTKKVVMRHNRFEENWGSSSFGLLLKDINDSTISHNVFSRNTVGIYAEGCNRTEIFHNDLSANGYAVKIMANCYRNVFRDNNFTGNTFDVTTNAKKRLENDFTGNYWSAYEGYDLDRDGIGDVPYVPVRLFAVMVEQQPETVILLRSFLVNILDTSERMMPMLAPDTLADKKPWMEPIRHDQD